MFVVVRFSNQRGCCTFDGGKYGTSAASSFDGQHCSFADYAAKQIFAIRMQPSFHLDFHSVVFTLLLTTTFSRPVDPAFIV